MVGRLVSTHPPWSMLKSRMTAPLFIERTMSRVTMMGTLAPGVRIAPISTSAKRATRATLKGYETIVVIRP